MGRGTEEEGVVGGDFPSPCMAGARGTTMWSAGESTTRAHVVQNQWVL